MEKFADFGKNSHNYSAGRRGYPEAVFYYLKVYVKESDSVLDVGCGTGISTRQLLLNGFQDVQGLDSDNEMLDRAKENAHSKFISYWNAPASSMPFRTQFFQAVTSFSSFHWLLDEDSIAEIRRVLKVNGILFIVQKEDVTPFREKIKQAIEEKLDMKFPEITTVQEIKTILQANRFTVEEPKSFIEEDLYSLEEAIQYIKSTSFWPAIPDNEKDYMLTLIVKPMLEELLELSKRERNRIIRRYNATCLVAHKK